MRYLFAVLVLSLSACGSEDDDYYDGPSDYEQPTSDGRVNPEPVDLSVAPDQSSDESPSVGSEESYSAGLKLMDVPLVEPTFEPSGAEDNSS